MNSQTRITAIVGSYRKGGVIDTAVDEILASATEEGAQVTKIYLLDKHIEFCTNCRACTQVAGPKRGTCSIVDDMSSVLDEIEQSDALVFASPMNVGMVTALTKRFMERLVCLTYWPWGMNSPQMRDKRKRKRAVLVSSSAAPSLIARLLTQIVKQLKDAASLLGAKTIDVLFIGLAAHQPRPDIGERARKKARLLGKKLAANNT